VHSARFSRELVFVDRLPALGDGAVGIDLSEALRPPDLSAQPWRMLSLAPYFQRHEHAWKRAFIDWLGRTNVEHACLAWWAHTTSAKNFLSSPLGNSVFEALAIVKVLEETQEQRVYVAGATRGQVAAISAWLKSSRGRWTIGDQCRPPRSYWTILRIFYQFGRVLIAFILRRPRKRPAEPGRVLLFTYVDQAFQDGRDAFFGMLAARLRPRLDKPALHVAFIHSPYLETLPKLEHARRFEYWPLYGEVRAVDLLWALSRSLGAWARISKWPLPDPVEGLDLTALREEALRWDLAKGGYFYNLLVYRAAIRMTRRLKPNRIIYPFENKSLEKMLLLGARAADPRLALVGYQHTSITPRHTTLLFAEGEAAATPLPERVITAGEVTCRYLEEHGRYPRGFLVSGGALRQAWREPFPRPDAKGQRLRVLLALSSSRRELRDAVTLMKTVVEAGARIELGIRPHPEFPLRTLPENLEQWAAANARDLAGTPLQDNLAWCDVAVYVSSTVALEALMVGRPVIKVRLSDPIDPDPLIGAPPLRFHAASGEELLVSLQAVAELPQAAYLPQRDAAIAYVKAYLAPFSDQHVELFLR
jgi:hypothetical protein